MQNPKNLKLTNRRWVSRFHILPCTAKTAPGGAADSRLREGVRWLLDTIDSVFATIDVKVARVGTFPTFHPKQLCFIGKI